VLFGEGSLGRVSELVVEEIYAALSLTALSDPPKTLLHASWWPTMFKPVAWLPVDANSIWVASDGAAYIATDDNGIVRIP
jgi:hypothetical protein